LNIYILNQKGYEKCFERLINMHEYDTYEEVLRSNGLKNTKHRNEILDLISKSEKPMTADDIYINLKKHNVSINISTVYRILDTLVSKNIIIKSNITGDSKALYELNRQEHKHHLICSGCRKMFTVDECPLEDYEKSLSNKLDFDITGHKLEIFGYCKECKNLYKDKK